MTGSVDEAFRLSIRAGMVRTEGRNNKSTPERRCNAIAQGPCRSTKGRNRLMAIVPQPADTPPPPRYAAVDGCPECVINTEAPILTHPVEGGFVAFYSCSDCGHDWSTAWGERA